MLTVDWERLARAETHPIRIFRLAENTGSGGGR
jgi:hypothetical protein